MRLEFTTKEESKQMQEDDFLKLSGSERIFAFFQLCKAVRQLPKKHEQEDESGNFVLIKKTKDGSVG
jgi:hypothetical protein